MCGIALIMNPVSVIDEKKLIKGTRALAHRGPDGEKIWISKKGNAGLGHRRLAIIDPFSGVQPLLNTDQTIAVVVNGELYGYKDIRSELESKGYKFQTQSDSEIVLHLYEEYGTDFLDYLRGEFAFIIYDEKKNQVFAGRDRFGIKPLQYHLDSNGTLYIASEAKAIFAAGVKAAFDRYALYHSFTLQYLPQDRTLFEGIYQLKPGHTLLYDANGLTIQKYWDLNYSIENKTGLEEPNEEKIADELEKALTESVSLRLQTDGPKYCSQLSGGLDSAIIAGIAAKLAPQKMRCFTISFPHPTYDETILANSKDVSESLSDAVYFSEGTAINSHLAAKYILNKKIREAGYAIALTGEGSDEALAGYIHLKADQLGEIPEESKKMDNIVAGVQLPFGEMLDMKEIEKALGYIPSFIAAKASIGFVLHSLMNPNFQKEYSTQMIMNDFTHSVDIDGELRGRDKIDQSSYLWIKFTLANYILKTLGDGTEMASSIEGRVPFLDHVFFEFTKTIPKALKIKNGVQKYILRKIAAKYVTQEIIDKPKQTFMAPPLSLFSDQAGISYVRNCFAGPNFASMELFDQEKVLKLIDDLPKLDMKGQIAQEPVIMLMLTTFLAYERFIL